MSTAPERTVGRYVLCDEVAAGGMATVHLGRLMGPVGFARIVAIKRLHAHFAKDPEFVAMLLDEARLAARIRHPNVVSTLDVVVEQGELLVVMDYVQGESLARLARAVFAAGGRVPLGIAMSIMSGALYGLHAAHDATNDQGQALGIVHRDVSPQNIQVGIDGIARVLDFGVAKAVGRVQTTREGTLKGKLAYMSPEQVRGDAVDRRSDIYAASVVLWELLCSARLFQGDNEAATINRIMGGVVVSPCQIFPDFPPSVDALVMRGLAQDPADRFQSAYDMAEAAQRVAYATPGDVAAWVQSQCGTAIQQRAARIAEIESHSSKQDDLATGKYQPKAAEDGATRFSAPVVAMLARDGQHTQVTDFSAATPAQRKRGARVPVSAILAMGGVAVLAAVVGVLVGIALMRREPEAAGTGGTSTSISTSTSTAKSPALALRDAELGASPPTPSASATSSAGIRAVPTVTATGRSVPPRSKCNPPYTLDSNGIRTPKPECL